MAEEQKSNKAPQKGQRIDIELPDAIAEGTYVNLAMVAHSPSEFVVDFIRMMPGKPKAQVKERIIMTPEHTRRFLNALADNIRKYEENFGAIQDRTQEQAFPMNFGPAGEA